MIVTGKAKPERALLALGACPEAREWAKKFPTLQAAWSQCKNDDWMLWILCPDHFTHREPPKRKPLVLLAADFVDMAVPFIEDKDVEAVTRATLSVTRAWALGEAKISEVDEAAEASWPYIQSSGYFPTIVAARYVALSVGENVDVFCSLREIVYEIGTYFFVHGGMSSPTLQKRVCDIIRLHFPEFPDLKTQNRR